MTARLAAHRVEEMGEADVPAVVALETVSFPGTPSDPRAVAEKEARLRDELARAWSHLWVIRDEGGHAVAFLLAWHVADEVHVLNVATHPAHRRRGVATALVAAVLDFARAKQARHVRLEVRRSNEGALRMYRAAGFYVVAIRKDYYPDGEDAIDMDLLLDDAGAVLHHEDETRLDA